MADILQAREERSLHIKQLMKDHPNQSIVILKANVVGSDKNPPHMRFLCSFFHDIVIRTFHRSIQLMGKVNSEDGNYCYFVIKERGRLVKARTIEIEEHNPLGRLIDLDVYDKEPISRHTMQCEMRKCLICDNFAHVCSRNKTHTEDEIQATVTSIIHTFLIDYLMTITIQAIYSELELYPKFGLVSHRDPGCHVDMNYETFIKSTFAIHHDIEQYIKEGLKQPIDALKLNKIGLSAERHMFLATRGVNTHKGLIFLLGVFLPVLVRAIIENEDETFVMKEIKSISTKIVGDYYTALSEDTKLSHGDDIYLTYGIKGIRAQALDGLSILFDIPTHVHYDDDIIHHQYLIELMSRLDDTTIIHKNDLHTLRQVQDDMKRLLAQGGYKANKDWFKTLSDQYKTDCISPGGSADMLVLKLIYEDTKHLLKRI